MLQDTRYNRDRKFLYPAYCEVEHYLIPTFILSLVLQFAFIIICPEFFTYHAYCHIYPRWYSLNILSGSSGDNKDTLRARCWQDHTRGGGGNNWESLHWIVSKMSEKSRAQQGLDFHGYFKLAVNWAKSILQDFSVNSQTYKVRRKTASPVKTENSLKPRWVGFPNYYV